MKVKLLSVLSMLISICAYGQNTPTITKCLASEAMQEFYKDHPDSKIEAERFESYSKRNRKTPNPGGYVIPVVFHVYDKVYYRTTVTEEIIQGALDLMNDDFNGRNEDFDEVHTKWLDKRGTLNITFKLAKIDPDGNSTNGIVYHEIKGGYANQKGYDDQIAEDAWDNYKYFNIYIQKDLYDTGSKFATSVGFFPDSKMSDNNTARVVFDGHSLGSIVDSEIPGYGHSSFLTHNTAHWLNLFDIAEGACEEPNDHVDDTPPTFGQLGCHPSDTASTPVNCFGELVNAENYMDQPLGCYKMFTQGQIDRMVAALNHPARITLWTLKNQIETGVIDNFINGNIYQDINRDCREDQNELGIGGLSIIINPGNIVADVHDNGTWGVETLPVGDYTILIDTTRTWKSVCPLPIPFTITDTTKEAIEATLPSIGVYSTNPCPEPNVSITMPFMRRCFSDQMVYVKACNAKAGTAIIENAYVDVELDLFLTFDTASISNYTDLGNNTFRFQIGDLTPGACESFTISTQVSCDAILNQTLCLKANLYPIDLCALDNTPDEIVDVDPCATEWDNSNIVLESDCSGREVIFTIYNLGNGDMTCYSQVRLFVDGQLIKLDSVLLQSKRLQKFAFPADGKTWRIEVDQNPWHPGQSKPSATIELCGDQSNWSAGMVSILPQNDADPVVDIYCNEATGSYDPNDKQGFPKGVTESHFIYPNQQLDYLIRFQNTGTDTAFNIVVCDTLSTDFDLFSVTPGASSHNYTFKKYGPRVLEWTFANIMLPDSTTDQLASNGFLTFTVKQVANLPNGKVLKNDADIYFDFNDPIITNETFHEVNDGIKKQVSLGVKLAESKQLNLSFYPNPVDDELTIVFDKLEQNAQIELFDILGKRVYQGTILNGQKSYTLSMSKLSKGIYTLSIDRNGNKMVGKVVKK